MILYKGSVKEFCEVVDGNQLIQTLEQVFKDKLGRHIPVREISAYTNSLPQMERILRKAEIPGDCGVLIEYIIPLTSNRVDFVIAGEDSSGNKNFVIVELKQWQTAESTSSDGIVKTILNGKTRETTHPSYQAESYKLFISDFSENIENKIISPQSCAYLHNYAEQSPEPLRESIYSEVVGRSGIYFRDDAVKLQEFIKRYVGKGKGGDILYKLTSGKVKPTKKLIDHVEGMLAGNAEYILIDEQKVAFEKARHIANNRKGKSVLIINGGPGTGKSVISVNLLGQLLKDKLNVMFVAPNASFRDVLVSKLVKNKSKIRVKNLFKGSGSFVDTPPDTFDVLIIDEAHRLKKRGAYMYQGINQIEDIIKASKNTIFFVDDDQVIREEDIGSSKAIRDVAIANQAQVTEISLSTQFRCSGAEGYMNWITDTLHIKSTGNYDGWDEKDFEFRIFDNPNEMRAAILAKHNSNYSARILAGYAWEWSPASAGNANAEIEDIVISEYSFKMPWNSRKSGTTWAIDLRGVDQIGCIHTCQGLEFDYVGVIVGKDLTFNSDTLTYSTNYNDYKDSQGKRKLRENPKELNRLVRNIYKILMTRGMKGCYVYFEDKGVERYFKSRMKPL